MKKFLMFALVAMVAGMAGAQTMTWVGDGCVYVVEQDTWYNAGATWGAGGAFDTHDFGTLVSWDLTLGGQAQTWWNDSLSHPATTVEMGYEVDATGANFVSLPWLSYASNNDTWENMTGVNVISVSGVGAGNHTVDVWFLANDGVNEIYDSNGGNNYVASFATAIPEPATMSLLGLGALAMALRRKMSK